MKRLKQLSAAVIALALTLSVGLTALAAGQYEGEISDPNHTFQNNEAQTTVSVLSIPNQNLSATVPLNVTFAVKDDGTFICPDEYAITNTGSEYIHVTDISVTMEDTSYSLVNSTALNDHEVYCTMTAANTLETEAVNFVCSAVSQEQSFGTTPNKKLLWNIAAGETLPLAFSGKMNSGNAHDFSTAHKLFTITYTIASGAY